MGGTSPSFAKLPGFPYRVPGQRIVGVVGYARPNGKWSFLFRTNRGLVFRFDRP